MLAILTPLLLGVTPVAEPIRCQTPTADRGEVRSGPPLVHTFRLTLAENGGKAEIIAVDGGCGCVRRDLSKTVLNKGEHADLTLTINTLTQPAGTNTWKATVTYRFTPDRGTPSEHRLELTVQGNIIREVSVTPAELAITTSKSTTQTITVTDTRTVPLKIIRINSTSPYLTAESTSVNPNESHTHTVTLTVSENLPEGERAETLTLVTNDANYPEFHIPVKVTKRKPETVTATPESLRLRLSSGQSVLSVIIQLRANGRRIQVQEVTSDTPAVSSIHSGNGNPVVTLRATVTIAAAEEKTGKANLRIRLTEPQDTILTIPIQWESR